MKNIKDIITKKVIAPLLIGICLAGSVSAAPYIPQKGTPLGNGYSIESKSGRDDLNLILGIMNGDVIVKRTAKGYITEGTIHPYSYSGEELDRLCSLADKDRDKFLTEVELKRTLELAYKVAAK
jgi:hypothetical protein